MASASATWSCWRMIRPACSAYTPPSGPRGGTVSGTTGTGSSGSSSWPPGSSGSGGAVVVVVSPTGGIVMVGWVVVGSVVVVVVGSPLPSSCASAGAPDAARPAARATTRATRRRRRITVGVVGMEGAGLKSGGGIVRPSPAVSEPGPLLRASAVEQGDPRRIDPNPHHRARRGQVVGGHIGLEGRGTGHVEAHARSRAGEGAGEDRRREGAARVEAHGLWTNERRPGGRVGRTEVAPGAVGATVADLHGDEVGEAEELGRPHRDRRSPHLRWRSGLHDPPGVEQHEPVREREGL